METLYSFDEAYACYTLAKNTSYSKMIELENFLNIFSQIEDYEGHTTTKKLWLAHIPFSLKSVVLCSEFNWNKSNISSNSQNILDNEHFYSELLSFFSYDDDSQVLAAVAQNSHTPTPILERLANLEDTEISQGLLRNIKLPLYMLERFIGLGVECRVLLAQRSDTPPKILSTLTQDESTKVRLAVASRYSHLTPQILVILSDDYNAEIRYKVATNYETPQKVLYRGAKSRIREIKIRVAQNTKSSERTLSCLLDHPASEDFGHDKDVDEYFYYKWVAKNHNLATRLANRLANSLNTEVREILASNLRCPLSVLNTLVDDNVRVRQALASNPNVSQKILETLSQDDNVDVRINVAKHERTPEKVLTKLFSDSQEDVRMFAARSYVLKKEMEKMLPKFVSPSAL